MPCEAKPRFVVLYGSQKGQAQSLAEGIAEEAEEHGLVADLSCLNQNDKYNLEKESAPVVFIVSTTGDGDPPDNALQFVRRIKKKTLSPDHYKHICYTLLALGDTNYANFCNCGKTVERRLQELGAKQFYPTGYADDGVGLEVVVEPWLEGLWRAIKEALSKMASERTPYLKENVEDSPKEIPDLSIPDVQLNLLNISDQQGCEQVRTSLKQGSKCVSPPDISDLRPASSARVSTPETQTCGDAVPLVASAPSLMCSPPPLSESSLNVPALPPPYLDVTFQKVDTMEQTVGPLNKETLYEVPISKAVQLSRGDSVKTALLLELDISAHPEMTYKPGDSFDVFSPNRAEEVDKMIHRLGLQDQTNHHVHVTLRKDTKKKGAQLPSHIPQNVSLLFLLTWCLEIRSVPKKAFVRALVEHTADGAHRRRLQELCSKQGAADYNLYVRDPSLSIQELLAAFPSCSPPLSLLIEHLPKLQPRPYSAASSCLKHPGKLRFVFNVVQFPACSGRPAGRRGLCTGWLFDLINPCLVFPVKAAESSSSLTLPKIHVSLRSNCSFRPPSDPSVPFIMVGPGTGVAPFIGFLQQRRSPASCVLFWGDYVNLSQGGIVHDLDSLLQTKPRRLMLLVNGMLHLPRGMRRGPCFGNKTTEVERKEKPEVVFGETWLFFGCRHKDKDFLFREELEDFVSSGTLTHLRVCFSRDNGGDEEAVTSAAQPKYVQHNLSLHSQQVTDVLFRQNGSVYVCGDAKNMAKDVNETLVEIIKTELHVDQLEAMKKLAELREEKRYLQDIWA